MRRPGGFAIVTEPGKATREWDTVTCSHCNSIVNVKPFQDASDAGGFCRRCMKHICGPCADIGNCVPFEKAMDAFEKGLVRSLARQDFLKQIG